MLKPTEIPFRQTNPSLGHWSGTFKSWPSSVKPWPDWYIRVSASKQTHWEELGIFICLALTIANTNKDESMLSAATYFWSDTFNAFLFGQGQMTPTLLDITMLTGLDITSSANPVSLNTKSKFSYKTRSIGGWIGYIKMNMGNGPVTLQEHVTFLMMWLEKFLFCGPSCSPTTNWQHLAEALVDERQFPLGKYLLGAIYQTLSSATTRIASDVVICHALKFPLSCFKIG